MSLVIDIADAVADELNAGTFSQTFIAERLYRPDFELAEMKTLHVSQGLRASCMITNFSREEPLEEAIKVKVTAKPTYAANAPTWLTVAA